MTAMLLMCGLVALVYGSPSPWAYLLAFGCMVLAVVAKYLGLDEPSRLIDSWGQWGLWMFGYAMGWVMCGVAERRFSRKRKGDSE